MSSTQPPGSLHKDTPRDEEILFGSLRFSLVTGEEIFEQTPEELLNNRDYEPEAPDVSTVPSSAIEDHPVREGASSRPRVNLPTLSQPQPVPDAGCEPQCSKGKQKEIVSDPEPAPVPAPAVPVAKWEPEKVIKNESDRASYVTVLRKIKIYIIGGDQVDIKASENTYKAAVLAACDRLRRASRRRVVFLAILRHVIGNFPKFCNPNVASGNAAANRIVKTIKYLTSAKFEERSKMKLSLEDINKAASDFCATAYPYPQTGTTSTHKASRLKFICFNNFAISLANQGLLDDLDVPKRAIFAMMGENEMSQSPGFNHESVFIVSKWFTTSLVDRLLQDEETKVMVPSIYGAISRYKPRYMALYQEHGQTEFKYYGIAIAAAQAKIEGRDKVYKNAEERAQMFKATTELAFEQVENGRPHPLANTFKEIVHLNEAARKEPNEQDRQGIILKLMTMVELCDQSLKVLHQAN
ncbi:hypothetical protein F4779DRAFT_595996 [Xylariaceae sp. FL0662B]|nr:hypothetical protein F4779DRAFT_595996 [Xylariaceae sp. FL0662B]